MNDHTLFTAREGEKDRSLSSAFWKTDNRKMVLKKKELD